MRSILVALSLCVAMPHAALGRIASLRTSIAEVHLPGTAKGMKYGAITLSWRAGETPELATVRLTMATALTAAGKEGRLPIKLAELKAGMTVAVTLFGSRTGDTTWMLGSLHVIDKDALPDLALIKLLASPWSSIEGTIADIQPVAAEHKDYVSRVELRRDKERFILLITKDTEIERKTGDKREPALLSDLKAGAAVYAMYPIFLASGTPPQAPATRVILVGSAK